ncbi:MAG: DUF1304 domain-containing protein [Bdellovibrionales bacterium]|nr:DUF1304 domain-containing protein [Bdellovibrionales bacterium]
MLVVLERLSVGVAAFVHVFIFVLESLLWGRPGVNLVFGISAEQAAQSRLFAFNQGFYNLFLAIGALVGVVLEVVGYSVVGNTLKYFSCLSMVGAASVLMYSQPHLIRAVLIQGGPPLVGLVLVGFQRL